MEIEYEKLIGELNVGIFILDRDLNIHYWNRWLEINTGVKKESAIQKKLTELFDFSSKEIDVLNRHIKSVLLLKTPSFYTAQVNNYLFPILYKSFTKTNFSHMQQDLTLFPYDIEKKQVGVFVYDQTILMDSQSKLQGEIKKRQEQEKMMIDQARFVTMSHMLENISHHWRQPLNALSVLIQELEFAQDDNELDRDYILETVKKSTSLIGQMSGTIDSFRNFFQPNEEKGVFLITDALDKTLSLVDLNLKENNINIHIDPKEIETENYFNSYCQVLFNIINTEIDFLTKNVDINNRHIFIDIEKRRGRTVISLFNNGLHLKKDDLKKIFDDPFINKKQVYTGINLYMTKVIVEKNLEGKISASSRQRSTYGSGVEFSIEV